MPSASKQQQKLMGIVHALQKGDMKPSQASGKAKEMAKSMKKGDVKDFASTKHKGLPKKVKKENMGVASMYLVRKPSGELSEKDMVCEFNPLEGIQPLNIGMQDVQRVTADVTQAQEIAAEAYKKYMDEVLQLEEKKGKVGDKLKKTIDHLEKKRKEHIDMAKEDPKNASQHKEHIAKLATQIDDLMSKMERIEKSKKNVEKKEDKESIKENKKSTYTIGDKIVGSNKVYFIYNNDTGTQSGSYKTKEEAQKELDKKNK
jgi:K+/H+ antiporter YhaU regulatory subunit KhtT